MCIETPYFIIHKKELDRNIDDFLKGLKNEWPNSRLAYSVKTNSLPWLLKYLHTRNVMAEVVSDEEYELAKKCGYGDAQIVFNGPIKGEKCLTDAVRLGAYVNLDSKNDLRIIQSVDRSGDNIGLRINPDPTIFNENDIGYSEDGFRFGFSDDKGELAEAITVVQNKQRRFGMHLHCNSITRSKDVYIALARFAAEIIEKYSLDVSYIDIGGGFFGGVPGKTTPTEYVSAIRNELEGVVNIEKTMLIVEPGSAIIGSVVDLVTRVVDVKDTSKSKIITTDGSRIHIDPLWIKKGYMYSVRTQSNRTIEKQIICGYTCMDHDRLMIVQNEKELLPGDQITYHRVGAYSMTFGGMFIRYYPDVYVKDAETMTRVRKRVSVNDYYALHNCEEQV